MTKINQKNILTPTVTCKQKNRYNIGLYQGQYPLDGSNKKISKAGTKLHSTATVEELLKQGASVITLWTRKCQSDVAKLELDLNDILILLREALQKGKHKGSEWCEQNNDGPVAACDAYVLKRMEWNKATQKHIECEYYIKFTISKTGKLLLLVSCHV